jgi:hypothetical protein
LISTNTTQLITETFPSSNSGPDTDKSDGIKLEFLMDPDNPALDSKYSRQFAIFKDGFPENWIKWVMVFREIKILMPMKETADKTRMFWALLKEQALSCFEHHLSKEVGGRRLRCP